MPNIDPIILGIVIAICMIDIVFIIAYIRSKDPRTLSAIVRATLCINLIGIILILIKTVIHTLSNVS